ADRAQCFHERNKVGFVSSGVGVLYDGISHRKLQGCIGLGAAVRMDGFCVKRLFANLDVHGVVLVRSVMGKAGEAAGAACLVSLAFRKWAISRLSAVLSDSAQAAYHVR